ncbi:unnamed protein product [Adineta steineri]|uniref:PLAT domain-containing protein n=1 Tax=Adineta steineri TaxID=433720 RepID=A0A815GBN7_9BILA|nr:unnamed protein product [Adineta steineri]
MSPNITFIGNLSTFASPLQYRRSENVYIIPYLQLNCSASLSTIIKWTIKQCSSNCLTEIELDESISTAGIDLYIPENTLLYGTYELKLTVTMKVSPNMSSTTFTYIEIIPSSIIANLIQYGTSMIVRGYQQNLTLNPGEYSVDPDTIIFNTSNWNYEYYCRIYGLYDFPSINGLLLSINDSRTDPSNPSCLSNHSRNGSALQYDGPIASRNSSLTILSSSFSSNRTYQIMVIMTNRQSSSIQAVGYLIVDVEDTNVEMILLACVISTMCIPDMEYQQINPTTQVALFSACADNCETIENITWNIYQGSINSSTNMTEWILFNQTNSYQNLCFFGMNTSNFTATNQLFINNPSIIYWRFEVVYSFGLQSSSSALNFIINQPPENGSCLINPTNGTTSTSFTISCFNWFDEDNIKDYLFYGWTIDPSDQVMLGFSFVSSIEMFLPGTTDNNSLLNIVVYIRDTFDCATEYNIPSIFVAQSNINVINNSFLPMLASGNQNRVNQIITSLSQQINQINDLAIETALTNGVSITQISISSLNSVTQQTIPSVSSNASALAEYNKQLNVYANIRDSLVTYITNLPITTVDSIKLQASSLAQFTQATNQLTRNSLTLVSDKCYQLALALQAQTTKISYDNVQTGVKYITQCANNILNAVNGPLQQRTTVLDLDWSRANNFPADYDTDLDYEWSNLNLFANGNDFSSETIEKGRNNYYQKQTADTINSQMTEITSLITNTLNTHLNIGQNFTLNSSEVFLSMETILSSSLSNKVIQQSGNTQIRIPSAFNLTTNDNSSISLRSMTQSLASADNSQSNTNLSRSVSLTILDRYGNEIPLRTNLTEKIELMIPRDPNIIIPSMTLQNVTSIQTNSHYQIFNLHFINLQQSQSVNNRSVSLIFEMKPFDINQSYLLIYRFDNSPQLNSSINQIDGWSLLCPSNLTNDTFYKYFLNNEQTFGHQSIILGLRELNSTEYETFCINQSINNNLPISNQPFNFTSNYELRTYTACCYYLDQNSIWRTDGILVGSETNYYQTQCFSNHLTTFAGGFLVLPSPINWNYVFQNADFSKNKTIYLTIICICILYILIVIYARYKDKKDLEKLGVTPLSDNYSTDQYFYQMIVFTGHRANAGTNSKVHFILAGEEDETAVRTFSDPHRKILQRGGIDAFIMAVPKSLGLLNYMRIWHDNSGLHDKASWFLKYIIVRDLQTMEKSYFICQQWFAVEKNDGRIERILPIAGELQKHEFSYVLSKQAYHSITEGHLWFSIFSRPPSNKFTCVQRCTCCFVLLFTAMLLNILYYDQTNETNINQTDGSLSFGPFYISSQQISIGIIVEILSFFPSLLLVQFFRRILPRQSIKSNKTKRSQLMFPWWCIFFAYSLSFILVLVSSFFIIVRGIQFGDLKTQKWLTSLLSGFFSSIFLIQPLKIVALAIFFAFFIRKSDKDNEAAEYLDDNIDLNHNEEYLHSKESPFIYRSQTRNVRLNESELACIRDQRLKEILNHLQKYFLNTNQIDNDYTKISTIDQYWNWLENSFISNIHAQQWYNGEAPQNLNGFINDKSNRLIGRVLMRQLRVKTSLCPTKLSLKCNEDYSFFNEDKNSYTPGWLNQTNEYSNSSIIRAFLYDNGENYDQYIYIGKYGTYNSGGYIYEYQGRLSDLQSNLSELHRLSWINSQTRAILLQLTLYNPNVQLFTSVKFLTEFLPTGGLLPQYRVEPITFQVFISSFQLICTIIYMIFIIYHIIIEIKSFFRIKFSYFYNFWSYIDIGIIGCSWGILGVYIWRYQQTISIGNRFQQTNGYVYINLQLLIYVNDILTYLLAFCCFFGTLKFLRLCRFHQRLLLFTKTLQYAKKDLFSFMFMFLFVFMAFLTLFYLLFSDKISSCSTLLHTAQTLFEMMLMKFDAYELSDAAPFLGPFSFSLFILLAVFVCMSMFITIINDNFRFVRNNMNMNDSEDQAVLLYMFHKFQRWIGLGQSFQITSTEEQDEAVRIEYRNPFETLPEKIDQLLDALNRVSVIYK